jgi:hypothetical protein
LTTLKENKIPPNKIFLVVHNKEQADMYKDGIPKELYNDIIITNENKGIYGQMNWVFKHYKEGQHILKLDDDISSFKKLQGGKLVKIKNIGDIIKKGFELCEQKDFKLFGLYPVANAYFMESQKEYTEDLRFVVGAFMGIINQRDNQIDLKIKIKGDYEYAINSFLKNGGMIRFNRVAFVYDITKNAGERISTMKSDAKILISKHPDLVKENLRRGDMGEILLSKGVSKIEGGKITNLDSIPIDDYTSKVIVVDDIDRTEKVKKLQTELYELLQKAKIPKIEQARKDGLNTRGDLLGYKGWTFTMGIGRRRQLGIGEFLSNKREPELFKKVVEYGNAILPTGFKYSTITINRNLKAKKHTDNGNTGFGAITFLGDYTGGGLYIYNKDDIPKLYDTNNRVIIFNGANLAHRTEPFKGDRYAMIFYSQQTDKTIKGLKMEGSGFVI